MADKKRCKNFVLGLPKGWDTLGYWNEIFLIGHSNLYLNRVELSIVKVKMTNNNSDLETNQLDS